jgi:threonine dehydratase
LLAGKFKVDGKIVVAILSGANVDVDLFDRLIAG